MAEELDTFRANFAPLGINLDPARGQTALEAQLLTAVYEGVVAYNPQTLQPVAGAAQSWEFSKDGLTLTLHLRPGLEFDNGTPLTAQDFRASWMRILDPKMQAPFASLLDPISGAQAWREGKLTDPAKLGMSTPDAQTIVITFSERSPQFLTILCHYAFVPVAPQWRVPHQVGLPPASGPFHIVSQTATDWILEKNPHYWDKANVSFPRLDFHFSDDAKLITKQFKEGNFDWVADGIDGTASIGAQYFSANALFGTSFFYFRTANAPWTDARVRLALILLLPLEELRKPYLQPTSVLIPQFQGYPKVEGIDKQDKTKALELLKEAGFPRGKGLPPIKVALPNDPSNEQFITLFQKAWGSIGLKVEATMVDGDYYDKLATLDHTVGYFSWIGDFLDPVTFLVLWKSGSSLNTFAYNNPAYDALLSKAATEDGEARLKVLADAETLLLQGGLLIPLSHTPGFNLIDRDEIGGWYPNPLDIHPFKNLVRRPPASIKNLIRFDLPQRM